jgi:hypothetical protein
MAYKENVTAGLISNADYKILKSVGTILGDAETSEGVIDTLYEVIDFLDQHAAGADLANILNAKADKTDLSDYAELAGTNTFTGSNTFGQSDTTKNSTVIFKAVNTRPSAIFAGGIGFTEAVNTLTLGYKSNTLAFYSSNTTLNLPFGFANNGDYLAIIRNYGEDGKTANTPVTVLSECEAITETTWATFI